MSGILDKNGENDMKRKIAYPPPETEWWGEVLKLSTPVSLIPAAFHRHAAAAAANPTGKGLAFASVGISHLSL